VCDKPRSGACGVKICGCKARVCLTIITHSQNTHHSSRIEIIWRESLSPTVCFFHMLYMYICGKNREKQARHSKNWVLHVVYQLPAGNAFRQCKMQNAKSKLRAAFSHLRFSSWQWQWHANRVYPSAQALSVCDFLSTRQFNRKIHARQLANAWWAKKGHCNCSYE